MFIKRILKFGLFAVVASALTTVQAQPAPKPDKPTKEKPERDDKKWDPAKVKERLKAAFENAGNIVETQRNVAIKFATIRSVAPRKIAALAN